MDLIDLIGDSRTDSLPAGFLRSIKIKYKQESSRVFPPGTPYNAEITGGKANSKEGEFQRTMSAASGASVPVTYSAMLRVSLLSLCTSFPVVANCLSPRRWLFF